MEQLRRSCFNLYRKSETVLHELKSVLWESTLRCNLNCGHCGSDCRSSSTISDADEVLFLNALDNIKSVYNPSKIMVGITGGEPLMRRDLSKIVDKVTKMGWTPTYNATNGGTVPVTPSVSGGKTVYITAAVGAVTMTAGSGVCTHTSTGNATVSDSDTSGVYLGFKGKGSVSATATITTAGYAPKTASGGSFATGASTSSNQSSELKKYITGVEIKASKTFKLKVPNGSSTVEFTWTVDSSGNVVVT